MEVVLLMTAFKGRVSLLQISVSLKGRLICGLSKMSISIRDYQGNLFNFGDDSGGPNKALQNMFIFKIFTLGKNQEILRQRNVY